jgi:hypothetical protein
VHEFAQEQSLSQKIIGILEFLLYLYYYYYYYYYILYGSQGDFTSPKKIPKHVFKLGI